MRANTTILHRLDALERARGGREIYVLLFGDQVDEFDAAYAAGDYEAALAVLVKANPHQPLDILRASLHQPSDAYRIGATTIRAEYGRVRDID